MTDDFNNKLADALWTLLEPRIQKLIEENADFDIDEKISEYMSGSFRLEDYSFDLDGMIDQQVQYLAEDGDLKEWLDINKTADDDNDDIFRQRVYSVINSEYDIRLVRK